MSEPIRILHVLGGVNLGGAESRIMDLYRTVDLEKVQFDFIVHTQDRGHFQDEIESMGGHVYHLPRFRIFNYVHYQQAWKQFFITHDFYRAVHGHMTSTASLYLKIAKKFGVPITIAHARSAGVDQGIKGTITKYLRRNLGKITDVCLACSKEAGIAVFGKKCMKQGKVQVIPNGINVREYKADQNQVNELRTRYGLEYKWVIGHVGRFHYAKNHDFLIEVFGTLREKHLDAVLLLVGEGPLMEQTKAKVTQMRLSESVIFAGKQSEIVLFYELMDYFVFPSHYEGMPGSVVEAQSTGVKCLLSDAITKEVEATDLVHYMSLEQTPQEWANYIEETKEYERFSRVDEMMEKGFDVQSQWEVLERIYRITELTDKDKR